MADNMPNTLSLGFADDVAFPTSNKSLDAVLRRIQTLANCELAWGSRHGAAFDQKKSQWLILTRFQLPPKLPQIMLGSVTFKLQENFKWLGVSLKSKLTFSLCGVELEKKGTCVVLK